MASILGSPATPPAISGGIPEAVRNAVIASARRSSAMATRTLSARSRAARWLSSSSPPYGGSWSTSLVMGTPPAAALRASPAPDE
jgi:hypothetical protein